MLRRTALLVLSTVALANAQGPVSVRLELPKDPVRRGETFQAVVEFAIGLDYHIYGPKESQGLPTSVALKETPGFTSAAATYPEPMVRDFPAQGGTFAVYEGTVRVSLPVTVSRDLAEAEHELAIHVKYQACTASTCLRPVETELVGKVLVRGTAEAAAPPPPERAVAAPPPAGAPRPKGAFERAREKGILSTLVIAFLTGLAACLTPCVFPILPVTVAYFGAHGKESWGGRFIMGIAYFVGLVLFYTGIGFAVALFSGKVAQLFANIFVVAGLDVFFLALALNMFGLYEITLPHWMSGGLAEKQRKGVLGAFVLGGVMSLVAFPCVGPFIGGLLPYVAAKGDWLVSLGSFVAFGAGLGGPFLFLSVFAGSLQSLPKAGEWMVKVKVFFGFVMLGMILYFTQVFLSEQTVLILAGILAVFQGTFCGAFTQLPRDAGAGAYFGKALGVLIVTAGLVLFVWGLAGDRFQPAVALAAADRARIQWRTGYNAAREVALREKKPMIVDFTAET